MGKFAEKLKAGRFVVTAEIAPPKGVELSATLERLEHYRNVVDAVNVTDQQAAVMRTSAVAFAHLVKERGFEPICQFTCRDRNIIALQSDLMGASALGIENILCLTGDGVGVGDHPSARAVFELDAVSLLRAARNLSEGHDMAGHPLEGSPCFFLGAAATPGASMPDEEISKMLAKVEAGAQFFQTQPVFEVEEFGRFMRLARSLDTPIIAGVMVLKSSRMARYLNEKIPGIHVPEHIIERLERHEHDAESLSIELAAEMAGQLTGMCQGIHLMAMGWEEKVPTILEKAGL